VSQKTFTSVLLCCLQQPTVVSYFAQMLSIGRIQQFLYVAFRLPFLCIFTNLKVQERYLPIIRGAGTPFPCVPRHFNHCLSAICISLLQTYSKLFRPNQNVLIDESVERWTRVGLTHRLCWVQCIVLGWVRFFICQWLGCCNSLNCKIHISSALLQYNKFIMPLMI